MLQSRSHLLNGCKLIPETTFKRECHEQIFSQKKGILTRQLVTTKNSNRTSSTSLNKVNQPHSSPEDMVLVISPVHKRSQAQAKTKSRKTPDEIKVMEKRLTSLSEENGILKKPPAS